MSEIVKPGQGLIYMKVGTHAQESLEEIIARKSKEIEEAGLAFWGYGGSTCHPQTMVQPFARRYEQKGEVIYLCMQEMDSKHAAPQIAAAEFSVDGIQWNPIPKGVRVLGSRYALVIKALRAADFDLRLDQTRVGIGNSIGANGSKYIAGKVDKACLEVLDANATTPSPLAERPIHISLVADLVSPYAVHLRNRS
jgi:hypothetical protein